MQYTAVKFTFSFVEDFASDIFVAQLAEIGFESFENDADGITAYIPTPNYSRKKLQQLLADFPYSGASLCEVITIADQNWNAEWEKHFFRPVIIDECAVHSSSDEIEQKVKYDIVINPKMAFGTGHHATTALLIGELLQIDLNGKSLLDMGCGTAVLAILAAMRGAQPITAIDIDNWCTENAAENIAINHVEGIEVLLGDAQLLSGRQFDVILANINRNILLMDMHTYADCLQADGVLYMSGFYTEDIPLLETEAQQLGLVMEGCREKDNWAVVKMRKS